VRIGIIFISLCSFIRSFLSGNLSTLLSQRLLIKRTEITIFLLHVAVLFITIELMNDHLLRS